MYELNLTRESNRQLFYKIGKAIESLGGKIVSDLGYEQLNYSLDQIYIDYNLNGNNFTLHLEYFAGISLLSNKVQPSELQKISKVVLDTLK